MDFVEVATTDALVEGEMRAVDVRGTRVLLTQVEGVAYAMGAICTHERANLDQGTLSGHEVYCPLHFSCFDVRTGQALEPPADRPAAVYAVKVEDGKVLVSAEPVPPEALEAGAAPDDTVSAAHEGPAATPPGWVEDAPAAQEPAPDAAPPVNEPIPTEPSLPGVTGGWQDRVIHRIEESSRLEDAAERLGAALRPVREDRRGAVLFDALHGRFALGHALHPALSDLPIGLWTGSVALDALGEDRAAGLLGLAGAGTGIATAVTGVADWTVSDGRDRRVGLLHGVLQLAGLAVQGVSLLARVRGRRRTAQLCSAASLGIASGSAYLGGHLVLARGVMVNHTAWTTGPPRWTRAIEESDLGEGEAKGVMADGRHVLVSRIDGAISAIDDVCTHAGGPLSRGRIENGVVRCPWHGSCFRLSDGTVVRGPAGFPQPVLETRVRDGWIELRAPRR